MNKVIALALLVLPLACGEKHSQADRKLLDESSILMEKSKNNDSSNAKQDVPGNTSERSKRTIEISGHAIDVLVEGASVKVMELPKAIKTSLKLKTFRRMAILTTIDKLRDECQSMNYKAQKHHLITGIRGAVYMNPFTSLNIKMALDRQSVPFAIGKLSGALDATGAHTEIFASYLTEAESASLKAWFDSYLALDKKAFDFEIWDDLDDATVPHVPIMELGRLVCGILLQEARLDFVLSTDDRRTLTVKVDNVSIEH